MIFCKSVAPKNAIGNASLLMKSEKMKKKTWMNLKKQCKKMKKIRKLHWKNKRQGEGSCRLLKNSKTGNTSTICLTFLTSLLFSAMRPPKNCIDLTS